MTKSVSSAPDAHAKKKKPRIMRYTIDTLPQPTEAQWARFNAIQEEDIDCSDIAELGEAFWKHAKLMPALIPQAANKTAVSIRIDPDILDWFKSHGKRYQSRINAVLRAYVETKKAE